MEKKTMPQLAEGFERVPLAEGFERVPLTESIPTEESKSTLEEVGETASDLGRGVLSGLTMGGLEELTAGGKALLSDEKNDFSTLYKKYLEIEEQKESEARERSPTASLVGEIGGSLLPAIATGGAGLAASGGRAAAQLGGKELLKAAGKGALAAGLTGAVQGGVTGALSSTEGGLIGASAEEKQKLLEDVKSGAVTGGVLGGVLGAAGPLASGAIQKSKEELLKYPLMQEMFESAKMGKEGLGFLQEQSSRNVLVKEEKDISTLAKKLKTMDRLAAKKIIDPLERASFDEVKVPMLRSEPFNALASEIEKKQPELAFNIKRLASGQTNPLEAHELRNTIKQMGPEYRELENEIKAAIDRAVPGYKDNLKNFSKFREATSESLIKKGTPVELRDSWLSDVTKPKENLLAAVEDTVQKLKFPGKESKDALAAMYSEEGGMIPLLNKLKNSSYGAELDDLARQSGFKNTADMIDSLKNEFEQTSLQSATIRSALGGRPEQEGLNQLKVSWARKPLVIGANLAGQAKKMSKDAFESISKGTPNIIKAPIQVGKSVYDFPVQKLDQIADTLIGRTGYSSYGKSLKDALAKGDNVKKEAILFALMQRPDFRESIPSMIGIGEEENE